MTRWLILSLLLLAAGCGLRPDPSPPPAHTGAAPVPDQGGGSPGM